MKKDVCSTFVKKKHVLKNNCLKQKQRNNKNKYQRALIYNLLLSDPKKASYNYQNTLHPKPGPSLAN